LKTSHKKSGHMAYNTVIWRKFMYMSLLYIINFYRNDKKKNLTGERKAIWNKTINP
jgi:hypothetical protein